MNGIWEVTDADILGIGDTKRLHGLLQCLLENELAKNQIPGRAASVSLSVTKPDGGEDALVSWLGEPPFTDWIPHSRTLFQVKGGRFPTADFKNEPFKNLAASRSERRAKVLKSRVSENLDRKGAYVFFCGGVLLTPAEKERATQEVRKELGALASEIIIAIYDAGDIASWVNKFAASKIRVLSWLGRNTLATYVTWEDWLTRPRRPVDPSWTPNAQMDQYIGLIRSTFRQARQVLRIVGLSGLGKSRTVLEAFRAPISPEQDPEQAALSGSLVYVIADEAKSQLLDNVALLAKMRVAGTLVVDDCPEDVHSSLSEWVGQPFSNLSLITIDYQVDDDAAESFVRFSSSDKETIAAILRNAGIVGADLDILVEYCDGFPRLAALIAALPADDRGDFKNLNRKSITDRLVWGRSPEPHDEQAREVIEACSLFAYAGFESPYEDHLKYIAEVICGITVDRFHQRAIDFIDRGVIQRMGAFVRVSPMPLALKLANDWIRRHGKQRWKDLFADPEMPSALKNALGQQFGELGGIEQAKELVRSLTDPDAPFGSAEVLNTVQGSRVFRSLSGANPAAAIAALTREFGTLSLERLKTVGPGRRNIIWALDVIVFNRALFCLAARLLARFALAENEKIGNNATSQFEHLYLPLLSGTEAPPMERLSVIDELLDSGDPDSQKLALRALSNAMAIGMASRVSGAERQAGRTLEDWRPNTNAEIYEYFEAAMKRLTTYGALSNDLGATARKGIASSIRVLARYGRLDTVETALTAITRSYKAAWPDAVGAVLDALKYETLTDEGQQRVQMWLDILSPQSLDERIRLLISVPPYGNMAEEADGKWIDLNEEAAGRLADELAQDVETLIEVLPLLNRGEQRQAFTFGKRLAEVLDRNTALDILDRVVVSLDVAAGEANPALLCGLLVAMRSVCPADVEIAMDKVAASKNLSRFLIYLTAWVSPNEHGLTRAYDVLRRGDLTVDAFRDFVYGAVLKHLPARFVCKYFSRFADFGVPGAYAALYIAYSYVRSDEQWKTCKPLFRRLVRTRGLFEISRRDTMDFWSLEQVAKRLLDDPAEGALAKALAREIVRTCKLASFPMSSYDVMTPIVFNLLEKQTESAWPIFRAALANARNAYLQFHLNYAMTSNLTMQDVPKSALSLLPDDTLKRWCEEEPALAPSVLMRNMKLFDLIDGDIVVPDLIDFIVETYGWNESMLSEMLANLETFSSVGSLTPYYEQRVAVVRHFLNSKNSAVATWAAALLPELERRVTNQKMRDEEHARGIFTPFYVGDIRPDAIDDGML